VTCFKAGCQRRAYYFSLANGRNGCGYHIAADDRGNLVKNPKAKDVRATRFLEDQRQAALAAATCASGSLCMKRLYMMKTPVDVRPGVLRVAPNHRATSRTLHLPELSPKVMGPVLHTMPGLPPSLSLENFHQGSKIFPHEVVSGVITERAREYRRRMFEDPKPRRHKFDDMKAVVGSGNLNVPLFSVFTSSKGDDRRYSYLEARMFYIRWYEHFCTLSEQFATLKRYLAEGYSIEIVGYDALEVHLSADSMAKAYRDASKPFGHEAVLCCLLLGLKPWSKDAEHAKYADMFPDFLRRT